MSIEEALRVMVREEVSAATDRLLAQLLSARPANNNVENRLLSLKDAAHLTGYSHETIGRWAREGRLRRFGTTRAVRVSERELLDHLSVKSPLNAEPVLSDAEIIELAKKRAAAGKK